MLPKVNISIGGKWHFYDIVLAAQEEGFLNHFYTTIYFKKESTVSSYLGERLNFKNRNHPDISNKKIICNFYPELIPLALKKVKILNEGRSLLLRCNMFDSWTKKVIDDCDLFHSQDGFCLETAKLIKKRGAKFICDRGIISASYLQNLSESEYGRFGIDKRYADCYISDRVHQEHLLADVILVPTETVKNSLIEEGIDGTKITVIPYGINLSFFQPIDGIKHDKFRVLFVGELSIRKGCHYLLEAWEKLKLKNAELIIIGNVEKGIRQMLNKYKNTFRHIPYISQGELLQYYSSSDVFVFPSLAEGSARVVYEAMACKLPVIFTEMSGSVARDQLDGFQIRAKNVDDIVEKIAFYYENRDIAKEMGISGQNWIKNFSKEKYGMEIIKLYKHLLSN
jgi:glycosyltransferase involved in cell wall biosynthesis